MGIPEYVKQIRQKIGHDRLLLAGACVILEDEAGRILLQQRTSGKWGLPGGLLELGETLAETAIREVKEETGLIVTELKQLHTFSGPFAYATLANQDKIYMVTTLYHVLAYQGTLHPDKEETLQLRFFAYDALPQKMEKNYVRYLEYYQKSLRNN
ncbi:NUDIX hydrolase [Ligilactobacillus faecis]|uniref:NUDIX domain-containing protein n=1 Tax=Ligilactobacillus faecis TaxID=762833 RepID=A0ABV4DR99_9LACO|nr:NUDIX domain-containing protein [Ligilactobacillus faecis]WGN89893.1 NUDIX domain-containing protein [Ligilactobacillus faecis]